MSPDRSQNSLHPKIIVTGANACVVLSWTLISNLTSSSGVGFAICQRLLTQLSYSSPPDVASREDSHQAPPLYPFTPTKSFTLILACRSPERASAARQRLLTFIDAEVARQRKIPGYIGHADDFRRGLSIDCLLLDLTSMESVFKFAKEARQRYSFLSILNFSSQYQQSIQVFLHNSPYIQCCNIRKRRDRLHRSSQAVLLGPCGGRNFSQI